MAEVVFFIPLVVVLSRDWAFRGLAGGGHDDVGAFSDSFVVLTCVESPSPIPRKR